MADSAWQQQIDALEKEIVERKQQLAALRLQGPRSEVPDYTFRRSDGSKVKLSELFGDKSELLIVHNMGKSCPYCTLWADGFNGLYFHIENKAGFAVSSPDTPEVMNEFAKSRNWRFTMLSTQENSFKRDLGFEVNGDYLPGVSSFAKTPEGKIEHVAWSYFGPGDDFNATWFFFDLLPSGRADWHPRFKY
ncbi:MAG: DUF899 family protein [bacterium]|nr:DUF899 family protein [bacterium]